MSSLRSLPGKLLLSLATVVLFLGGLEGLCRLGEERKPPAPQVADYIWDWDEKMPGGFYALHTGSVGWPPWEEFNRDGFRDRTHAEEKPEGWRRVVFLGDSVTLGEGVAPSFAYPRALELRLWQEGRRIEVLNVALWGWSTQQERIAYGQYVRKYRPDEVVLAVCLNDIPELQNNLGRPPRWLSALHERSALVRRLVNAPRREITSVEELLTKKDSPKVRQGMRRFFEELRALRSEVEGDGTAFAVLVFPFRFQVEPKSPPPTVQAEIAAFCAAEKTRCLDLLPVLARAGAAAFFDYDHLGEAGSALTAEAIRASGLLPESVSDREILRRRLAGKEDSLPALLKALRDPDRVLRAAAAWGLGRGGAEAAPAAVSLGEALGTDESEAVRLGAARALGAIGPGARAAIPALFAALSDPRQNVRWEAALALARMDLAEEAPELEQALGSRDRYVRSFATWTLGNLGPAARPAVPALIRVMSDPDAYSRGGAVAALTSLGPIAAEAVPALAGVLKDADASKRTKVAKALGRIGPAAQAAVPDLIAALADPAPSVRAQAARALGRIGPGALPAAAELQRATGDRDAEVRREAREALDRLH